MWSWYCMNAHVHSRHHTHWQCTLQYCGYMTNFKEGFIIYKGCYLQSGGIGNVHVHVRVHVCKHASAQIQVPHTCTWTNHHGTHTTVLLTNSYNYYVPTHSEGIGASVHCNGDWACGGSGCHQVGLTSRGDPHNPGLWRSDKALVELALALLGRSAWMD